MKKLALILVIALFSVVSANAQISKGSFPIPDCVVEFNYSGQFSRWHSAEVDNCNFDGAWATSMVAGVTIPSSSFPDLNDENTSVVLDLTVDIINDQGVVVCSGHIVKTIYYWNGNHQYFDWDHWSLVALPHDIHL
jgi:hypothetical protein